MASAAALLKCGATVGSSQIRRSTGTGVGVGDGVGEGDVTGVALGLAAVVAVVGEGLGASSAEAGARPVLQAARTLETAEATTANNVRRFSIPGSSRATR